MVSEKVNTEEINILKLLQERVKFGNIKSLTDVELLTLILGAHLPKSRATKRSIQSEMECLLGKLDGDLSVVETMECDELARLTSMPTKLVTTLLALVEVSSRIKFNRKSDIEVIKNSMDTYNLLSSILSHANTEEFWVVYLSRGNRILEYTQISHGGVSQSTVDVRLVIKKGLNNLASKIILAHNHPSGSVVPSDKDVELTDKITNAAKFFDMLVIDHVIISKDKYYSFSDHLNAQHEE